MTSAFTPANVIFLVPLAAAEPGQLRRWLGREAWLRTPCVSLRYEPGPDRMIFRLIDVPSAASGYLEGEDPLGLGADLFVGFDGTDADAWVTTIALLDFGRHRNQGTSQLSVTRDLVGEETWQTAIALEDASGGERELALSPAEAASLISRWGDLVVSLDDIRPSDEALDAARAEWAAALMAGVTARDTSRSGGPVRSSVTNGPHAGQQVESQGATGAGAAMSYQSPAPLDGGPPGPIRYRFRDRLSDRWAARRDGRANVPPLSAPAGAPATAPASGPYSITPFMEVRNREYLELAERERSRMLTDLAQTYGAQQASLIARIAEAEQRAESARTRLSDLSANSPDLTRRNVLEQHADESLIRDRRSREFTALRNQAQGEVEEATRQVAQLRGQQEQLAGAMMARQQLLESRVNQLRHHALRRCATYISHIVRHHPDGSEVTRYLEMARPGLPDWLTAGQPPGPSANGQGGP